MKRIRTFRLVTALVALFCVLSMQFAVMAYACPGMSLGRATAQSGHQAMAGCHGMDAKQPALCEAHDRSGNQSLDKPEIPQIPPFVPARLVASLELSADDRQPPAMPAQESILTRATSPPLAIRHCCFRN
jgi:hypothetical protein